MKMRDALRHLAALLAVVLPLNLLAPVAQVSAAAPPQLPGPARQEIVERRSEYAKHFREADGKVTMEVYAAPVHQRDERGNWQAIDRGIKASQRAAFGWSHASARFRADFAQTSGDRVARMEAGEHWVEWSLEGLAQVPGQAKGGDVTYPQVLPGVDLRYKPTANGVKEELVVSDDGTPHTYQIRLRSDLNVEPYFGGLRLTDAAGATVMTMPTPFVVDGAGETSVAGLFHLGGDLYELRIDENWFRHPHRVFPMIIDPTLELQPSGAAGMDTSITSAAPALNYGGDTILRVGRNGTHQSRALLKFAVADLPAGAEVSSAQLSLYRTAGVGNTGLRGFELHALTTEWLETEATWQNAKGYKTWTTAGGDMDAAIIDGTKQIDTTTATTGNGWVTWNVTSQVSAVARGGANLGFILQHTQSDTNRSEIHFTGSDSADSIHAPKLVITYTEDRTPPTVSITSTGPVTGNQVALQAQATDLGAGIDRVEFLVDGGVVGTAVTTDASGLYTVTVDSTRYTNGDHLVDVRAYDRAGNVGTEGNSVLLGSLAGATPGGDARLDGEAASLLVSAVPVTAGAPVVSGTKAVSDYSAARVRDSNNSTSWKSPGQSTSSGIESILLNLSSTRSVSEVLVTPARASDKLMARVELLDANGNPVNTGSSAWVTLTDGTDQQRAISLPFVSTSTAKVRVSFTNLRYDALTGLHHAEVAEIRVRYSYWETDHYDIYLWDGVSAGTSYGCTVSKTTTGNCSQSFDKGVSSAWANQRWVGSESCSTCGARSEQFIGPSVNIGTYSYQGNYTWRWTGTISWTTADPHTRTTTGSRRTVNTTTCPGVCENYSNYWWNSYVLFADSGQFSPDNGQMYWSNWPSDRRTFFGGWYTPGVATSFSVYESYYQYSYSSKTITFEVDRKTFQADSSLYTSDVSFTPEAPAYTESTAPTNAIDGNAGTFWLGTPAGGTGQRSDTAWIELPFASATTVNAVYIDPLAAGMSATVVVSLAGAEVSRTVVGDLRKGLITFPAVTADRIRVEFSTLLGGGPAYYAGLREVKPQHIAAGQNGTLISPAVTLGGASHLTLEAEDAQPAGTAIAYQFIFDQSVAVSATPGTPVAVPAGAASVAVHATLTGDGTKSPFLYNWSLTAPGSGRLLAFQNGPLSVVQEPAVLTFTSPLPQTTVTGSVSVQVTTSSAQVAQVKFYVDGVLSNTDTAAPWAWTWNTAAVPSGPHMLWAEAYNASGQKIGGGVSSAIVPSGSPLALTAVAAAGGTQLSWTAPVAGASYKIYRSTDNFVANSALVTTMTGTTFTDTGLVTGTRYYYRVTAVSGGAEGRPSLTASAVFGQPEAGGDRLGLERYYPYLTTPIAGHRAYVNLTNGNLVTQAEDLVLASPGLMAVVRRTMNTRPQPGSAAADRRWNHQISLAYDSAAQTAVLTNSDGAVYRFPEANGLFQRPAGVYIWLARSGTGYTATHKNGVTWTFDAAGTLVSAKDRNGNTMQYRYDADGQISQIVDTAGRPIDFGVTPSGQIGTVTYGPAADRRSVTYGYDALGRVSSVTDLAGQTWQYAYDLQDRLVAVTSPQGNIWSMIYDSSGRLSALADPLTNLISLSYGNLSTVVTDGRGNTTTFAYNTTGQLVKRTQVAGTQTITEQMAYDPEYNVTSLTNPLNKVTTATYDARGNLLTLVSPAPDAQASPVTVEYRYADPANPDQPTEVRHPLGIVELMAYDAYGNLTYRAQTRSGEAPTAYQRYAYNAYGLRVSERSLQGGITHYEYDARGNLIKTT
ncbi:MAG TPA: DNRLRE domain-containing protein, partial [Symbiobacteriaceae bacterium]|nr:DNRLRE domain-containing protein [Symbiobacteriaceae bacterium]